MAELCIGVDVGGTFTDAVLIDGARVWTAKAPTTADVGEGVLAACSLAAERAGASLAELLPNVKRFGLGTTAVTNAIASRRGARVGLITTKGFEETFHLARARVATVDQRLRRDADLIDAEDIVGADERIDRHGVVLKPLDLDAVLAATAPLVDAGVEAIAISLVWSIVNPSHEQQIAEAIARRWPGLPATSGAALFPVLREYERTALAVLNAYVSRAFLGVEALERQLTAAGLAAPLLLVHSGGGAISVAEAKGRPVWLAESGPAAGVAAAAALAARSGAAHCITCDMGGTSFDVSDVRGGAPSRVNRGELMGVWTALPRVDVESIGAGGGSIAWIDARGMLRVGPQSAGSNPGPVCYGRGGVEPTVTDALVVLRYIDPDNFLGGDMKLDRAAALAACARFGARLGFDAEAAAWGIREIALAEMTKAVRTRLAMRGLDPREHPLISYGGCGSLFTGEIAKALSAPKVIVPDVASVLSAQGAAISDVRRERMRTVLLPMPVEIAGLQALCDDLAAEVAVDLAADGVAPADRHVFLEADLRFMRQMWELAIPLSTPIDAAVIEQLLGAFREEYVKRYGVGSVLMGTPVELVGVRAVGVGSTARDARAPRVEQPGRQADLGSGTHRRVRAGAGASEVLDVQAYGQAGLGAGEWLSGPAIIERPDTTIWIPEGMRARRDHNASIILELS